MANGSVLRWDGRLEKIDKRIWICYDKQNFQERGEQDHDEAGYASGQKMGLPRDRNQDPVMDLVLLSYL